MCPSQSTWSRSHTAGCTSVTKFATPGWRLSSHSYSRQYQTVGTGPADATVRVRRGVKALVPSGDRVLLVQERHADRTPYWTFPGGGVRAGETPPEALAREAHEELACRVVVADALTSFWYPHTSLENTVSVYDVSECFLLSRPSPVGREGIVSLRWVRPTDPPARTLPHVRSVLERWSDSRDSRRRPENQ